MRTFRAITLAALALAVAGAAVGCGSEAPTPDPTKGPSASENPGGTTGSESDGPAVPSDWKVASADVAQLQVPPDWTVTSNADQTQTMRAPKDSIGVSPGSGNIVAGPHAGDGDGESAVNALADLRQDELARDLKNLKRLPNETINGSIFYHFQGEDEYTWQDHYGTVVPGGDDRVSMSWDFNKSDIDRKGADTLIEPIMATYEVL